MKNEKIIPKASDKFIHETAHRFVYDCFFQHQWSTRHSTQEMNNQINDLYKVLRQLAETWRLQKESLYSVIKIYSESDSGLAKLFKIDEDNLERAWEKEPKTDDSILSLFQNEIDEAVAACEVLSFTLKKNKGRQPKEARNRILRAILDEWEIDKTKLSKNIVKSINDTPRIAYVRETLRHVEEMAKDMASGIKDKNGKPVSKSEREIDDSKDELEDELIKDLPHKIFKLNPNDPKLEGTITYLIKGK